MSKNNPSDPFDRLCVRFFGQLDSLVPFLALAHREIFDVLSTEYSAWFPDDDRQTTLPRNMQEYFHQVAHAAFLLGYSYAEAFITDVICEVYCLRKDLLPPDKALQFKELVPLGNIEEVVRRMIDNTLGDMNSLEKKIRHMERWLGLRVDRTAQLLEAQVARNAIVHNAGRVNRSDPDGSRWNVGDTVRLSVDEVHQFGLMAREYGERLCSRAKQLCAHH